MQETVLPGLEELPDRAHIEWFYCALRIPTTAQSERWLSIEERERERKEGGLAKGKILFLKAGVQEVEAES
jgi:hypothetical protein